MSCNRQVCQTYKPVKNYKGYKVIRKQHKASRTAMKNMTPLNFGFYSWEK